MGVRPRDAGDGYYTADSVEASAKLIAPAAPAGARLYNTICAEDVMMRQDRICGVVINSSAAEVAGLRAGPLAMRAECVIDGAGHPVEVVPVLQRKVGRLRTPSGQIGGGRSMWAEAGERMTVESTVEAHDNLYVRGMASNAAMGAPRVGPMFGGMLRSGKKVADMMIARDRKGKRRRFSPPRP